MNASELAGTWAVLEPTERQRRRIEAGVREWLEARESSLAGEWLELFKVNPIAGLSFAAVAACPVLIATPLNWVAFAVL
jgi:hypothetical protein